MMTLKGMLKISIRRATWKSKMAAIFQDGRHLGLEISIDIMKWDLYSAYENFSDKVLCFETW